MVCVCGVCINTNSAQITSVQRLNLIAPALHSLLRSLSGSFGYTVAGCWALCTEQREREREKDRGREKVRERERERERERNPATVSMAL